MSKNCLNQDIDEDITELHNLRIQSITIIGENRIPSRTIKTSLILGPIGTCRPTKAPEQRKNNDPKIDEK
jgi:hypothetical protein